MLSLVFRIFPRVERWHRKLQFMQSQLYGQPVLLSNFEEAVRSAIENVLAAIPEAQLIEISPDLVNLADLADVLGCSHQNIRKYAAGEIRTVKAAFPEPVHAGGNSSLWRLAEVLSWFEANTEIRPPKPVFNLSWVSSSKNIEVQQQRLNAPCGRMTEKGAEAYSAATVLTTCSSSRKLGRTS